MTIFGDTNITINGSQLLHTQTLADCVMNYGLGLLLVGVIPPGLLLNILVFAKNHLQPETPSSVMYRCLAVVDFLVCGVRGYQQVGALLSPIQQNFYEYDHPSVTTKIVAVITLSGGVCMMTTVTLLSLIRLASLLWPFRSRQYTTEIKVFVIVAEVVFAATALGVAIHYITHETVYWSSVTQWIIPFTGERAQVIIDIVIPLVSMTMTTLASLATVIYLFRANDGTRRRGSITVLLMSMGLITWNVMLFGTAPLLPIARGTMPVYLREGRYEIYYFYYIVTCYFPILLTVFNSAVVVCRSSEIRRMLREWRGSVRQWFRALGQGGKVANIQVSNDTDERTPIITPGYSSS